MAVFYLELYQGALPTSFESLPGAGNYQPGDGTYWAVLTHTTSAPEASAFLQPTALASYSNTVTHGTDTWDSDDDHLVLTSLCIWNPKTPPYRFVVTRPDGIEVSLDPAGSEDGHAWWCQSASSDGSPLGIYVVWVTSLDGSPLPEDVDGLNARLNTARLPFSSDFFEKQPLLRVTGFEQAINPGCPKVAESELEGCAPGNVNFRVAIDQLQGLDALLWQFGDGTVVSFGIAVQGNSAVPTDLTVLPPGSFSADQIAIEVGDATVVELSYVYANQNLPTTILNGSVTLVRPGCAESTFTELLQIPLCDSTGGACPDIFGPHYEFLSEQCQDGAWPVSFSATVASDYYGGDLRLVNEDNGQIFGHQALGQNEQITTDGGLELTGSQTLPPGNYRIYAENDCSSSSTTFQLGPCTTPCPEIEYLLATSGRDCVGGRRPVEIPVEIRLPPGPKTPVQVQIVDEEGQTLEQGYSLSGQMVLTVSATYPAGEHSVRVVVLQPEGCEYPDGSDTYHFTVAPCPDCPDIQISEIQVSAAGECRSGVRNVTSTATVTPSAQFEGTLDATLSDDSQTLDSVTAATGGVQLTGNSNYEPGTHNVRVEVASSHGCDYSATRRFTVAPCVRPPWFPDWLPTPPDWLCMIWLVFNFLLIISTAIFIGVAACIPPLLPIYGTIAVVLALMTLLSWFLWALFCGWKPNVCPFARWLPRIIAAIGFVAAVIVLVIAIVEAVLLALGTIELGGGGTVASLPCFAGVVIEFGYFSLLAYIVWEALLMVGCPPLPLISLPEVPSPEE